MSYVLHNSRCTSRERLGRIILLPVVCVAGHIVCLASMFFLRAITFLLLLFIEADIGVMFMFAVIFGTLNFATFPVIANIVATHLGVRILGLTLGLLFGGHSLGAAIGVSIGGWMFDLTARYSWIWLLSIVLAALAGVFAILVKAIRPIGTESG